MLFKGSYGKDPAVHGSAREELPFRLLITKTLLLRDLFMRIPPLFFGIVDPEPTRAAGALGFRGSRGFDLGYQ